MKKRIQIDDDLLVAATEYVEAQLATMRKFESAPNLTEEAYDELVYKCAKYPQELRNLTTKLEKRKGKETAYADSEAAI
jgi:hypothetical protein